MKALKVITAIGLMAFMASCSNDDDSNTTVISESQIPPALLAYQAAHFPNNPITKVVKDIEGNTVTYEMFLQGQFELEFNGSYAIQDIDGRSKLPDSVIPEPILDYVSQNYPDRFITDWELETNHQQVELDNKLELEFDRAGAFIRIDND